MNGDGDPTSSPIARDNLAVAIGDMTDEEFAAIGYQVVVNNPPTVEAGQRAELNGYAKNDDGAWAWNYEVVTLDQFYLTNIYIRHQRDMLLRDTDWSVLPDCPLSDEDKAAYTVYRRALRDLPAAYPEVKSPEDVTWPEVPNAPTEADVPE
jgi:hypothetical protein